jgi:hypothetical protein
MRLNNGVNNVNLRKRKKREEDDTLDTSPSKKIRTLKKNDVEQSSFNTLPKPNTFYRAPELHLSPKFPDENKQYMKPLDEESQRKSQQEKIICHHHSDDHHEQEQRKECTFCHTHPPEPLTEILGDKLCKFFPEDAEYCFICRIEVAKLVLEHLRKERQKEKTFYGYKANMLFVFEILLDRVFIGTEVLSFTALQKIVQKRYPNQKLTRNQVSNGVTKQLKNFIFFKDDAIDAKLEDNMPKQSSKRTKRVTNFFAVLGTHNISAIYERAPELKSTFKLEECMAALDKELEGKKEKVGRHVTKSFDDVLSMESVLQIRFQQDDVLANLFDSLISNPLPNTGFKKKKRCNMMEAFWTMCPDGDLKNLEKCDLKCPCWKAKKEKNEQKEKPPKDDPSSCWNFKDIIQHIGSIQFLCDQLVYLRSGRSVKPTLIQFTSYMYQILKISEM